jgi:hypothetical protein
MAKNNDSPKDKLIWLLLLSDIFSKEDKSHPAHMVQWPSNTLLIVAEDNDNFPHVMRRRARFYYNAAEGNHTSSENARRAGQINWTLYIASGAKKAINNTKWAITQKIADAPNDLERLFLQNLSLQLGAVLVELEEVENMIKDYNFSKTGKISKKEYKEEDIKDLYAEF